MYMVFDYGVVMENIRFDGKLKYRIDNVGYIQVVRNANYLFEYKKGNFTYKGNVSSPKELAQLCRSMENMATELERLEQVRKDFVSNVSHELKTPITSITGFTETLLDGAIDDKQTSIHFLEIIKSQSKRLSAIIEDLLSLSRLEKDSKKPEMIK